MFLTFSKAAAQEARERLQQMEEFKGMGKSVATFHSMCAKLLGLKKNNIACTRDYNEVLSSLKLPKIHSLRFVGATDEDAKISQQLIQYHGLVSNSPNISKDPPERYEEFAEAWKKYKNEKYVYDYPELLTEGLKILKSQRPEDRPKLRLLCVDEIQDLSTIQWEIALELSKSAVKSYFAGDDDQCIYNFAGADVNKLVSLQNEMSIQRLEKSRRVPQAVVDVANPVIQSVENRIPKTLQSNGNKGRVDIMGDWLAIRILKILDKKAEKEKAPSVLILARTNYLAIKLEAMVKAHAPTLAKKAGVTTIHKSKGKEADIVVLWTKITNRVLLGSGAEEEARLFYVGMTRAKKRLIILRPKGKEFEIA